MNETAKNAYVVSYVHIVKKKVNYIRMDFD